VRGALPGNRLSGRRRRVDLESHDLRRHQDEDSGARGAKAGRPEPVRDRQRCGETVPDGGDQLRAGGAGGDELRSGRSREWRETMRTPGLGFVFASAIAVAGVSAGQYGDVVDRHVNAARTAAGTNHTSLFNSLCSANNIKPPANPPQRGRAGGPGGAPPGPPDRSTWHAEPVKVF